MAKRIKARRAYQLEFTRSGDGHTVKYGEPVTSLAACAALLDKAEVEWQEWFDKYSDNDYEPLEGQAEWLDHYEGCDVYARCTDGRLYAFNDEDGWDLIS